MNAVACEQCPHWLSILVGVRPMLLPWMCNQRGMCIHRQIVAAIKGGQENAQAQSTLGQLGSGRAAGTPLENGFLCSKCLSHFADTMATSLKG
jgi:hypothetical protein